jgi:tRNA-specific 2-thiouridylase
MGQFEFLSSSFVTTLTATPPAQRILVALSGGVDSAVAALQLKQSGADVEAAYMKNWINEDEIIGDCPWEQDIVDARAVAEHLGIPFRVVNLMEEYRDRVVAYLLDEYRRGLTPNPDVMCNRDIKFGVFAQWARDHGFGAVATGHYAQRQSIDDGSWQMIEGADPNKDQTYFLALLDQAQLAAARFPIGHLAKPDLRAIAQKAGLPNATKKDSQGICFIGQVKMQDFLREYVPDDPGPIVRATDETRLGEHRGLHFYTLGQRKGIGVPSNTEGEAYVVVGKRASDRALLVAFDRPTAPGLFTTTSVVHHLRWNIAQPPTESCQLEGKVRYRDPRVPLTFSPDPTHPGIATVTFRTPQRGLAAGQILALYDGPRLLGGGIYK